MLVIGLCAATISALSDADFQTADNADGGVTIVKYSGWDADITIPAKIGGKAVTGIGKEAFKDADLTGVVIPDSVTAIGESAFFGNKLAKLTIGKGIISIGNGMFYGNQLTSVTLGNGVISIGAYAFAENQLTSVTVPANLSLARDTFAQDFILAYENNGTKAGTYTYSDERWAYKAR
jgi:hypothetical protein